MSMVEIYITVALAIVDAFLLARIIREHRMKYVSRYILNELASVYFCGYKLRDVYLLKFFPRYREFVDWGFCGPVAAMSMFALKNNKTARYVYA